MGILNNIWTALSTPNEGLVNLLAIPSIIIEIFLLINLMLSILSLKISKKQKLILYTLLPTLGIIDMYILKSPFNVIINYFILLIVTYFVLDISFFKNFFAVILSVLIFSIVSSLILNPFLTILSINSSELSNIFIYRFFYSLLIYLFIAIVILVLKNKNFKFNFIEDIDAKSKRIIFANLLLGLLTLVVQTILAFYYIDNLPILITFLNFAIFLSYFCISLYSFSRVFKLTLVTRKLQSAEEYNNTLRILHDNVRGFKHDFDNIVTTIGGYIRTNDMEGLKKYYVQLEDDCQRVNNLYILNPDIVNNDGVYNLLTKKYHEAEEKDIKVNITFLLDLSTLKMKIYEFARILGILLDNAIEASSECEEKVINLIFRDDSKNSRQLIIVENTYSDKNVNTEKIFEKGVSGKSNHTGLGLWEVRKLVKKNHNLNLYTSKDDKFFKQQLEIYY